jgi:uncharacterized protein (TIGR00645 family)
MTEQKTGFEQEVTSTVFAARWIMAPMYLGVIIALAFLTFIFCRDVLQYIPQLMTMSRADALIMALSIIELAFAINMLFVVLVAGSQKFLVDTRNDTGLAGPFVALKSQLIAAFVGLAGIGLLKRALEVGAQTKEFSSAELFWFVAVFMSFVLAWVMITTAAWMSRRSN